MCESFVGFISFMFPFVALEEISGLLNALLLQAQFSLEFDVVYICTSVPHEISLRSLVGDCVGV